MKRSYTYLKGLLTLALAALTGWMWAAELVIPYTFDGKTGNTEYAYEYQVKMPSEALTSFTTTIRYAGGSHRVEILSVKLIDGETEYTAVATGTDGNEIADAGSYSGGNNYLNIFTFTNGEGFPANKVYTLQANLKVTDNPPSHNGNIKVSGGITLYVPPYSFGVNFTVGGDAISTTEGAGFTKGTYAKPTNWGNFTGSASGNGTITVENNTLKVYWTARGTWNSGTDKSTDESKLLYGYLDDTVNNGRTKATVTITGLPSDKQYAVALILSGDGANNTDFNGKFSPALINGQTYSYVDGVLVSGEAATAENAKKWGDRSMAAAAAGLAEGTNVMFVEGLSGSILTITSAMDAQNTSRLTIAGVQVWTTEDALVAPAAPTDNEVISLNFYSSQGSVDVDDEAGLVAAQGWENLGASGTETTLAVWNGEKATDLPISLTYSSANGYQYTGGVTDNYIKGYLDDGNQAQVTVENIPFKEYSVIVYSATDTENKKFKPVLINGSYYTGVATPTAYGYADLVLEGEQNLRIWGGSRNPVAAYGKNALRVNGLTDSTLTIKGGTNGDGARGGIAAVQIINTGAALPDEQVIDWTAQPADQVKVSALPNLTNPFVKLKLADGVTLVVDAAIPAGHFIEIVGNNVAVNITKLEVGKADVEAIVSGAASVTTSYSETLGYTKDDVTYPLIFRGTTDANWATLSNWYIGTRTQGETTYWIPYTGTVVPGAPNSNEWRATLVDGELMAIAAGEDGYKTVTLPTLANGNAQHEGWATKIAAYNGVHIVIAKANKFQSNAESGPGFLRVDDTSKITYQAYANGNGAGDKSIYVNAENGVVFAEGTTSGIQNMTYYFDGDGSVAFATLNQAQTIAGLVLDLGTADEGRKIVSRKLIGFTGGGATFTVADGAVTTTAEDVTLEAADILQNVGQYKFEKKDNDGYYVSYVAYAEEDEIGAMNTWTAKVDGNWNTAGNWSSGFVPDEDATATIAITANTTITIPDAGVTVGTLVVNGAGTLTIEGGKLTATKIFANANIAAGETTLALAPMNIAEGKTVTYTTTTTMADPDSMGASSHALSLKAMTGAGTFVKKGAGVIGLFATAAEPAIVIEEGAIYVRETPATAMNIAAKAGAEIRLCAWHNNFANTANKITLDGGAQLTLANGANVSGTITIANAAETAAKICGSSFNDSTIAAAITGAGKVEFADGGAFGENKYPCDGATTYTGVISGELQVIISDTSAVTFTAANTYTGGTVIAEGVSLNAGTGSLGTGAVTGAGKLVVAGYPSNATVRTSLGAAEWTGTYVNTADNTLADNGNWLGAVGNANSIVEFTGTNSGFLAQAGSMNAALKVTGSITFNNGFSNDGGYTFNGALLGTGTLATQNAQTDVLKFLGETKDFAGTITVAGGHCIAFGEQADTGTAHEGKLIVAAGKTANIAAGKTWTAVNGIEVAGTIGGEGTIGSTLILLNGATLANAMTLEGNVTVAEGTDINHAYATEAGDTVITCANAEAVATALTGAPEGLRYVAEEGAVKLAVAKVNVTIPTAPANTKWYDADGNEVEAGTIAVDPNEDVTLTLKADDGYVFADGSTSTTVTVNAGETGATITVPEVETAEAKAMIGETPYLTFAEALAAAQAGQTITLLADVTASEIITIEKAITLDGNGKTLTSTAARAINVDCAGEVTIKNLTVTTTGERGINVINKACTLTLTAVNVTAYNYTVNVAATAAEAKVTITDSTLTGKNVVNVAASDAIITIDGTTLTCVDKSANEYYATLFLNKDAKGATITATNMTFNLSGDSKKATNQAENGTITIDGLTNEVSINVATLVRGEYWYGFETIDAALATAEAGETITLIRDVTASEIITIEKAITLDGNGKTLTSTAARAINVDCAGAVTIKNLTIVAAERAINIINQAATVTINGVTATADNNAVMIATSAGAVNLSIDDCSFTGLAVVSVNGAGAQVTIDNSTIANVDANKNENYGAITVGDTAIGATVDVDDVTNTKITVMDDSKKAYNFAPSATITGVDQVGVVVAMIGDAGYDTIEEAADDVKAGQTIVLVTDVETDEVLSIAGTLDLNGKTSKGTILGKIAVNGGTYVTAENVPVIGTNARAFETTNAVFTMDAVAGNITLNAGTVTAKGWDNGNNWTVPGQALVVKSGVALTVPAEVTMQVNGTSITIEDGATLNIAGKINLYSADATIKAPEGLNVVTTVAGCEVKYADGKYTVVESIVVPPAIAEDENIPAETKEAIKAAMEAAGVTKIDTYTITTKGADNDADADAVAAVLEVFEVTPTVDEDGELTVAYEFGISAMTNVGEVITITAGVTGAEYRAGVEVAFYADGVEIGTATTTADSTTVSITNIQATAINGKKITVKAIK